MPSRQPDFTHQRSTKHTDAFIFIIITVFTSAFILFALIYFIYYIWYSLIHRTRTTPLDSHPFLPKLRRFTYKELSSATNRFSAGNFIGRGGSGTVYRAILSTGNLAAVKVLDSDSLDAEREFENEIRILEGLESKFVVKLLGYCVVKEKSKTKRLVVYEYVPNRSLQEQLFGEISLKWKQRFEIIVDVSRALEYLHLCDPPVIHGDVKPSNVLLDAEFRAKLSDFGLSRFKIAQEFAVDSFSQDESPVDFAFALQASSSSSPIETSVVGNQLGLGFVNERENVGESVSNKLTDLGNNDVRELDLKNLKSEEEGNEEGKKQWGKDWWWKQDGSGELSSRDYVREWIGSQICPSVNPDWDDENENENRRGEEKRSWKHHRKMEDWWKEEQVDEEKERKVVKKVKKGRFKLKLKIYKRKIKMNGHDHDHKSVFGFEKKSKKSKSDEVMNGGDVFSRELSSTTSMRGTLCYVAPERSGYGPYVGCEYLLEKTDVYSLGVLILVVVSGRRPLHVLASPMKLEKANLISWCRQLAHGGDLLELVDERLKDEYDKTQASLCVNLALACLQKMPELRPDVGDVVKILRGEMELPVDPFEFSPSPPLKVVGRSRSRRKNKSSVV